MTEKNGSPLIGLSCAVGRKNVLERKSPPPPPHGTEKEPLRLNHELQVHQVELEIQNAEPIKVQEGVRIPRLLLAEDDPVIQQVLGLMLKRSNYNIDIAEDGLKVIEMWEKGGHDLILMDVQMPRLDGFEATRLIRENERERGGHTPIVAMTALVSKEAEERCLDAGMDAYISKPIDFKKTLQVIGDILKHSATP